MLQAARRATLRLLLPSGNTCSSLLIRPAFAWRYCSRDFATIEDCQQEIDKINQLFVEARDEIDYAKEDAETVYFNDSVKEATAAVDQVMSQWKGVLGKLDEAEKMKLQRSMGLKMEQLKAELEQLHHLHS